MFLGSYTYSGQPAALLAGYRRVVHAVLRAPVPLDVPR